jgi:hypothetical protein
MCRWAEQGREGHLELGRCGINKKKNEVGISFRAQLVLVAKENGKAFLNYKHDFEFKPRVCKHFQIKILN